MRTIYATFKHRIDSRKLYEQLGGDARVIDLGGTVYVIARGDLPSAQGVLARCWAFGAFELAVEGGGKNEKAEKTDFASG